MKRITKICLDNHSILPMVRYVFFHFAYRLRLIVGNTVKCVGLSNISQHSGTLQLGFIGPEFIVDSEPTLLYLKGKLDLTGYVTINKGTRICVMEEGQLNLTNCFINSNVIIMCEHGISVGDGSAIGWGTQICDADYHKIEYSQGDYKGKSEQNIQNYKNVVPNGGGVSCSVSIGKSVLICNNCYIYKGVHIAEGCVVASNSVVKESFNKPNMLIAGNPAKEICKIQKWA